jgi:hypothetical protein
MPQFCACSFKSGDKRLYTYQNDGPEVFPGDRVKVPDNRSDGWKAVTVVSVTDEEPPFACKPILGRVEDVPAPAEPDDLDILDAADLDRVHDDPPVVQF